MDISSILKIVLILIDAVGLWLAFWVFFANPKAKLNRLFCLMTLSLLFVWSAGWFFTSAHKLGFSQNFSTWFGRITLAVASVSFVLIYFFITNFPEEQKKKDLLDRIIVFLAILFFLFPLVTDLVVKSTTVNPWGTDPVYGNGKWLFYGWIFYLMILIMVKLISKYIKSSKEVKLKLQYFLIGFLIFITMNLIFNIIFPMVRGNIRYWEFGNYSSVFLLGFSAFAIVRKQLFGIKIVLIQSLVAIIAIILFVAPFVVDIFWVKILFFSVFSLFCVFGYLLIKYTLREVKQKEILEGMVEERTKDLEKEKNIAEERAREIEKRKEDLERFYSLTVGRELKMIELKEKIKELEEKVEQ